MESLIKGEKMFNRWHVRGIVTIIVVVVASVCVVLGIGVPLWYQITVGGCLAWYAVTNSKVSGVIK